MPRRADEGRVVPMAGSSQPSAGMRMVVYQPQSYDDTQRIIEYPKRGFAIPQDVPAEVEAAYGRLVEAGFTARLI